jgi:hypothetical protein
MPAHLRMHGKVGIALPRALLAVGEARMPHRLAVHLLFLAEGQRAQRLRQQRRLRHVHRHFARARAEQRPSTPTTSPRSNSSTSAKASPSTSFLKYSWMRPVSSATCAKIVLPCPRQRHHAAGDAHRRPLLRLAKQRHRRPAAVRAVVAIRERRDAERREGRPASRDAPASRGSVIAHRRPTRRARGACLRNASMNGSMPRPSPCARRSS